jgi:hypothetical protein
MHKSVDVLTGFRNPQIAVFHGRYIASHVSVSKNPLEVVIFQKWLVRRKSKGGKIPVVVVVVVSQS